ncbi:hypothetical protein WKK05_15095 [Nostoc sp. UHCC 0302]|uniref:hypothetical protein n=1 Tax=Nostoc sp. UHCC 0302 TaxID=3134896 RepID=UPI00311CC71D
MISTPPEPAKSPSLPPSPALSPELASAAAWECTSMTSQGDSRTPSLRDAIANGEASYALASPNDSTPVGNLCHS